MKPFDSETIARLEAGQVDYLDALTGIFDSGPLHLFRGQGGFDWEDEVVGAASFVGAGALLSIEVPAGQTGNETPAIRVRLAETYVPAGASVPVNVFDDGVRASIDEEPWQWREVILSVFWLSETGAVLYREQVARRVIDAMPVETDEDGMPVRVAVLEQPAIVQRDVEGKTANSEFQRLIDPADRFFEHVGTTALRQTITLGAMPEQEAT